jgi:hypothetical protein
MSPYGTAGAVRAALLQCRAVLFYVVRFLCRWFELNFLDFVSATRGEKLTGPISAHAIIREKRQAKDLSEAAFADACGFYPVFTSIIEFDTGVVLYPFEVSRSVCRVLELDQRAFAHFALLSIL